MSTLGTIESQKGSKHKNSEPQPQFFWFLYKIKLKPASFEIWPKKVKIKEKFTEFFAMLSSVCRKKIYGIYRKNQSCNASSLEEQMAFTA